jgi:RHS repeat-associated protein
MRIKCEPSRVWLRQCARFLRKPCSASYTANLLNQYTNREVPDFVNVIGTASNLATVTLWGDNGAFSPTSRKGDYFRGELAVTNTANPVWLTITNLAVLNNGSNPDIVTNAIGRTFVPQTPELFYYDADGNLTNDGRWIYTWDAENRLVQQESLTAAPTGSKFKLEFAYDARGRRLQKLVSTNNGSSYVAQYTNRFAYDRWNLIATLNPQLAILNSFAWGLDLSGSQQGAGGVSGLLLVRSVELGVTNYVAHDGNGNVAALVNVANGGVTAQYEYGPFGELLRVTGVSAKANPFRFSTKYQDDESDFLYYGYRSYNPDTGRWLSRDPIEERGGKNIYEFVANSPIRFYDKLGLQLGFSGFGEIDWRHSQPWDSATIANSLCPFKCNGKAYNPITECCCKGKIVKRKRQGTGVYLCSIPFTHSWVFIADQPGGTTGTGYGWWSKEYDDGTNMGKSCGSASDAVSVGKIKDDSYNPDHCKEIKLRPCSSDINKFRDEVVKYWKSLEGSTYVYLVYDCRHAAKGSIEKAQIKALGCTAGN